MAAYEYGYSGKPDFGDDDDLVRRIAAGHAAARRDFGGHGGSFWAQFEEMHSNLNEALRSDDLATLGHLLRTPTETDLHWGFDDTTKWGHGVRLEDATSRAKQAKLTYDALVQVAIACGALRMPYPEADQPLPAPVVDEVIPAIDAAMGVKLEFPNPYEHEFGLVSGRGTIGFRPVHALYQAWRIATVLRNVNGRSVLEIGAGTGRTAFYARKLGVQSYTIVDIPSTQLAQSSFLGRVLPAASLSLPDEPDAAVNIRTPTWLFDKGRRFDLTANIDSLTEMDREHASAYVRYARGHSRIFLSINHEYNPVPVRDLLREQGMSAFHRLPYAPRPGYVEELVFTRPLPLRP